VLRPRVVVVDDHELVRQGIRASLERASLPCEVVGEAATIADARTAIARATPDVAVLDVVLPDGDGIQLCREVRTRHPDTACLLLTTFPEPRAKLSAALAGAAAYLAKDTNGDELGRIVTAVAHGRRLLDDHAITAILDQLRTVDAEDPRLAQLTRQESRVFELIGQGLSNRQIAERLQLAERTVKNYTSRLLDKLEMERRSEAAVLAARLAERRAQRRAREGATGT
jgi:two-component system, NarL family, response regulator DevR